MTDLRAALAQPEPQGNAEIERVNDICQRVNKGTLTISEALRAQPEPQGPTDEEIRDLWSWAAGQDQGPWPTQQHCFARAVLARWGRPAIKPVPVGERMPGPEDCIHPTGECWWFEPAADGAWYVDTYQGNYTHWLAHHALPVPQQEVDHG